MQLFQKSQYFASIGGAQWEHGAKTMSYSRRCDVMTSHRRALGVIFTPYAYWEALFKELIVIVKGGQEENDSLASLKSETIHRNVGLTGSKRTVSY